MLISYDSESVFRRSSIKITQWKDTQNTKENVQIKCSIVSDYILVLKKKTNSVINIFVFFIQLTDRPELTVNLIQILAEFSIFVKRPKNTVLLCSLGTLNRNISVLCNVKMVNLARRVAELNDEQSSSINS